MELRNYQQEDANFLASLPCSACFNEQRTGKTPTALETIKIRNLQDDRILIVTTASSLYQWKDDEVLLERNNKGKYYAKFYL